MSDPEHPTAPAVGPLTPGQWLDELLAMPGRVRRIEQMAEMTQAALAELDAAIAEVAGELEEVARGADDETAAAIRSRAERLRGLRPDVAPEPTPEPGPTP